MFTYFLTTYLHTYLFTNLLTYLSTYLLTYLLTYSIQQNPSWEANRFSVSQEIPRFFLTRRFITASKSARHLSISWASSIQSIPPHPSSWASILIFFSPLCLALSSGLFPSGSLTKSLYTCLFSPIRATCPAHLNFSPAQYCVSSTDHAAPQK